MVPTYILDHCIDEDWTSNCTARDIAVVRVYRPSGESFPGSMGFGHYTKSTLEDHNKYLRGYPRCGGEGDPTTNCRDWTLYGDSNRCTLGKFSKKSNGWNRVIEHSCDTSPGMSGSALYLYRSGEPRVLGVHSSSDEDCYAGCSESTPQSMRRIDPWWYGEMLNFMGL